MSKTEQIKRHKSAYVKKEVTASRENPWASELASTIVTKNSTVAVGKAQTLITSEGEISEGFAVQAIKKKVDKEEFIKIFEAGISSIFGLNKSAKDLFQAIMKLYLKQKMVSEQIYISAEDLLEVGYSRTKPTRTTALNQLLNLGFLCEVSNKPNQFWVNPNMFFKGNRLQIFQDFAVEGTKEAVAMEKEAKALEAASKQPRLPLSKGEEK